MKARFEEEVVYTSEDPTTGFWATDDGLHAFWFARSADGRLRFVYDGRPGEPFDAVDLDGDDDPIVIRSQDGLHAAYIASRRGEYFMGVDDREHATFGATDAPSQPEFSDDGRHVAYIAYPGRVPRIVLDGEPVATDGWPEWVGFAPSGSRLVWVERDGPRPEARSRVVLDGKPGAWCPAISVNPGLAFSADGRRLAYVEILEDGGRFIIDGEPAVRFRNLLALDDDPEARAGYPTFSPDGRRFAYAAVFDQGCSVVEDGQLGPAFEGVADIAFSADSRQLAYGATRAVNRQVVVLDGEPGPEFPEIWGPHAFSADGTQHAYLARSVAGLFGIRSSWTAVVNGLPRPTRFDQPGSAVVYAPNGNRMAFAARKGGSWSVVVDDREGRQFEAVSAPEFSRDGMLAHAALVEGRWTVVVDDVAGPLLDVVAPPNWTFGPDGRTIAWVGYSVDGGRPIVDSTVGPEYPAVSQPTFPDANAVVFWAGSGNKLVRLTAILD